MLSLRIIINNITFKTIKGNLYIMLLNIILITTPIIFFGLPDWFNDKACYILC